MSGLEKSNKYNMIEQAISGRWNGTLEQKR